MYQQSAPIIHPKKFKKLMNWGDNWWDSCPDSAFSNYEQAANQGYDVAQYYLGLMYEEGRGAPKSREKAIEWYQKAAEQGHAAAKEKLIALQQKSNAATSSSTSSSNTTALSPTQLVTEGLKYWESDPSKAFSYLQKAANLGYADAQFHLGIMYETIRGFAKNGREAVEWYQKAAEQGHSGAQFNLGVICENRRGAENVAEAIKWYQKAANQGNADAQFNLGAIYEYGQGKTKNEAEAIKWYQKAAEQGHADAKEKFIALRHALTKERLLASQQKSNVAMQSSTSSGNTTGLSPAQLVTEGLKYWESDPSKAFNFMQQAANQGLAVAQFKVGVLYRTGQGVPQSDAKALEWFQKAANQDHRDAQLILGLIYYDGRGVQKNYSKAVEWFQKAADQGDSDAQNFLGALYKDGVGVPQSDAKALEWFQKAADQGDAGAQFHLGVMYRDGRGVPQNYTKALEWYQKAANQGNVEAQVNLGVMYREGRGVPQNYTKAVEWYQKAANQGDAAGQNNLGIMYENGLGVTQNDTKAVELFQKAAHQGNANAQFYLGKAYKNGRGVPQNDSLAVEWWQKAANQGDADAQGFLGWMYENGLGIPQSKAKAIEWYQKAADKGHLVATNALVALQKKQVTSSAPAPSKLPPIINPKITPVKKEGQEEKVNKLTSTPADSSNNTDFTGNFTSISTHTVPHPQAKIPATTKEKQEEKRDKLEKPAKKESKGLFGFLKKKTKSETVDFAKPTSLTTSATAPAPKVASLPLPKVTTPITTVPSSTKIDATGNVTLSVAIPSADLTFGRELGRGAFGVVYQGTWHDSPVAIKTLLLHDMKQEVLDNFIQEASVMIALKHPNIIQLSGISLDRTPYCMVMEFMENGSLYSYLHSSRPLDFPLQVQIAMDVARGLSYLHGKLILHRDLKSLNVLLDDRLRAKLADFGLSKVRHQTMSQTAGKMVGTPQWMAPELFDMEDETSKGNEKSDMYSYGMVLWELLTRRDPFEGSHDPFQIAMRVMQGKRETIPQEANPTFQQLIKKCWDKKPDQRPSAKDALEQLQPLHQQRGSLPAASASEVDYTGNLASGQPASSSSRMQSYTGNLASGQPVASNSQAKPGFFPPPPLDSYQGNLASGVRSTLPRPGKK